MSVADGDGEGVGLIGRRGAVGCGGVTDGGGGGVGVRTGGRIDGDGAALDARGRAGVARGVAVGIGGAADAAGDHAGAAVDIGHRRGACGRVGVERRDAHGHRHFDGAAVSVADGDGEGVSPVGGGGAVGCGGMSDGGGGGVGVRAGGGVDGDGATLGARRRPGEARGVTIGVGDRDRTGDGTVGWIGDGRSGRSDSGIRIVGKDVQAYRNREGVVSVGDGHREGVQLVGGAGPVGGCGVAGLLGGGVGEGAGGRVDGDGATGRGTGAQRVGQGAVGGVVDRDGSGCAPRGGVRTGCRITISGGAGQNGVDVDHDGGLAGPEPAQQPEQSAEVRRCADDVVDDHAELIVAAEGCGLCVGGVGEVAVRIDGDHTVLGLAGDRVDRCRVVVVDGVQRAGDGAVGGLSEDDRIHGGALVVPGVLEGTDGVPQRHHGLRHRDGGHR